MTTMDNKMQELLDSLDNLIDDNFDFEVEHWDNGNFDDSYEYGVKVGHQEAYRDIKRLIEAL